MDAYQQLIADGDDLRALLQRWRSNPRNTAELLPAVVRALRTTAAAKEEVLYPAIRRHAPERADLVDEAIRTDVHVEGFLAAAQRLAPDAPGFLDEAHAAAAAADELILHERRDLLPALRDDSMSELELVRIVDRFRTARALYEDDDRMLEPSGRASGRVDKRGH